MARNFRNGSLANTVTAVATAQTDDSPLLLLSGEVSTQIEGAGQFQDASAQTLDDVAILKPITRYSSSVDNSKALPRLLRRAFLHLRAKPSGPVHLSLPRDCLTDDLDAIYVPITQSLADPQILSQTGANASLQHFASGPHCCPARNRINSTGYVILRRRYHHLYPDRLGKAGFSQKSARTKSVETCRARH